MKKKNPKGTGFLINNATISCKLHCRRKLLNTQRLYKTLLHFIKPHGVVKRPLCRVQVLCIFTGNCRRSEGLSDAKPKKSHQNVVKPKSTSEKTCRFFLRFRVFLNRCRRIGDFKEISDRSEAISGRYWETATILIVAIEVENYPSLNQIQDFLSFALGRQKSQLAN